MSEGPPVPQEIQNRARRLTSHSESEIRLPSYEGCYNCNCKTLLIYS